MPLSEPLVCDICPAVYCDALTVDDSHKLALWLSTGYWKSPLKFEQLQWVNKDFYINL